MGTSDPILPTGTEISWPVPCTAESGCWANSLLDSARCARGDLCAALSNGEWDFGRACKTACYLGRCLNALRCTRSLCRLARRLAPNDAEGGALW